MAVTDSEKVKGVSKAQRRIMRKAELSSLRRRREQSNERPR